MRQVLAPEEIGRALTRLAHEIVEAGDGTDSLLLLGIRTRGIPIARRLAGLIAEISGSEVPCGTVDVTLYRDDLRHRGPLPLGASDFPTPVDGKIVVLVDDVLYTGRTIRAALEAVMEVGRPRAVRLAVLIDRGHRELPIRADHVGKNLPTSLDEEVRVLIEEQDGEDAVIITEREPVA